MHSSPSCRITCLSHCLSLSLCAETNASTFSGYDTLHAGDVACPPASCTLVARGNHVEDLVQCDHLTFDHNGTKSDEPGRQCESRFHALCNTNTKLSMPNTDGHGVVDRGAVEKHLYAGRTGLNFCREHRPAHSELARSGHVSSTICSVLCVKNMMGDAFDTRCSHTVVEASGKTVHGCHKYFHFQCMSKSLVPSLNTVLGSHSLYCVDHLPAGCELVLDDSTTEGFHGGSSFKAYVATPQDTRKSTHACTHICVHIV